MFTLKKLVKPYVDSATRQLINLATKSPISSKYVGSPKGFWCRSKDYVDRLQSQDPQAAYYDRFMDSAFIHRQLPKTTEEMHWKFAQGCCHHQPESFVLTLSRGRVLGEAGWIMTSDDALLLDVSLQFGVGTDPDRAKSHPAFHYLKLPHCRTIKGTVAVVVSPGHQNYFHWMTDGLPRLELLRRTPSIDLDQIDFFVVNAKTSIVEQCLTALGIPETKLIFAHPHLHLEADPLIVPSLPGETGNPPLWACQFLRDALLPSPEEQSEPTRRIYVSRSKAKVRRILNEAEVVEALSPFGFETVFLEDLTLADQVKLFSSAQTIVAPHGAGLTNLLFCQPHTQVLEIFSPKYVNVCFWILANQLRLDYHYAMGAGEQVKDTDDSGSVGEDIVIERDRLQQALKLMLQ